MPIKLLTAHVNRDGDNIYGIASDNNTLPGLFGPRLLLYRLTKE